MEMRAVSEKVKSMEQLSLNNGNGQSYGYIVYRKKLNLQQGSVLSMRGRPRDLLQVNNHPRISTKIKKKEFNLIL